MQENGKYQIEKGSMVPATGSIVTFLRWPPIQGGTNEIVIYFSNGTNPIYKYKALGCSSVFYNLRVHENGAITKQRQPYPQSHVVHN